MVASFLFIFCSLKRWVGAIHLLCPALPWSSMQAHCSLENTLQFSGDPHTLPRETGLWNTVDTYLGEGLAYTFQASTWKLADIYWGKYEKFLVVFRVGVVVVFSLCLFIGLFLLGNILLALLSHSELVTADLSLNQKLKFQFGKEKAKRALTHCFLLSMFPTKLRKRKNVQFD